MRFWFLRFLFPWWGAREPRRVHLNVKTASVVSYEKGYTVSEVEVERTVAEWAGARRTVREVI